MKLQQLVDQIVADKTITPSLEYKINELLWAPDFDWYDMQALEALLDILLNEEINTADYH